MKEKNNRNTDRKNIEAIPEEPLAPINKFRSEHPTKHIYYNSVDWEYISCGSGNEVLLVLTGGLRIAETSFAYIQMFEDDYRIIAPSYPPVGAMRELAEGIATILDKEKILSAIVLGQSYGGAVAQALIKYYPLKVKKVILSGTTPMIAIGWKKHLTSGMLGIATILPEKTVLNLFERMLSQVLAVQDSMRLFWKLYLKEVCEKRLTKADVISHLRTTLDIQMNPEYKRSAERNWSGDMLVIWGENDHLRKESTRKGMVDLYPQAQIRIIKNAGHTAAMAKPEEYSELVREFLGKKV